MSQLSEELEVARNESVIAASVLFALETKNEADELAHSRAVDRHRDAIERFQALLAETRKHHQSMHTKLLDQASVHEELVHTTSDAKEQAASRVAELKTSKLIADRQLTSQRDLLSKATAKVDQLTKVVAKLEDEKTGALAVTGEAVKDMEASGRRDEELSTEITQLREVLIVKVAECDRLQALQLTGPGAADLRLPAKLLATET